MDAAAMLGHLSSMQRYRIADPVGFLWLACLGGPGIAGVGLLLLVVVPIALLSPWDASNVAVSLASALMLGTVGGIVFGFLPALVAALACLAWQKVGPITLPDVLAISVLSTLAVTWVMGPAGGHLFMATIGLLAALVVWSLARRESLVVPWDAD